MAYGSKYILHYETELTKSDFWIVIYADGYIGEPAYKKIGAGRVQLSKDKDSRISGSALDFSIQADVDFEYADFFNANNKAHKVELYFGTAEHPFLYWTGYIVSDQYSEPYIAPPYDVEVMCTDGLGLLKSEDFALTGLVSRFTAIRYILDKIGFDFPYSVNIDLFEKNMPVPCYNMLAELYFQAEIFADKNCYEVLDKLLPEGVTITQQDSRWLIERTCDIGKERYRYNHDGTYASSSYFSGNNFIGKISDGFLYPIGNLTMEFQPAWKNCIINQVFGKKDSFLKNYDFKAGITHWTETGGTGFLSAVILKSGTFGVISGRQSSLTKYISQSVQLKSFSPIQVEIAFAPVGYYRRDGMATASVFQVEVVFQIMLTNTASTTNYYLNQFGWVTDSAAADKKIIGINGVETSQFYDDLKLQSLKMSVSKLPEDGLLTVKIFQVVFAENTNYYFGGLVIQKVLIFASDLALYSDSEETKVNIVENATSEGETIELMPVDLPDYDNAEAFFDNGNFIKVGLDYIPAALWTVAEIRYLNYLAIFLGNQYSVKRSLLKGTLSGYGLSLNICIEHVMTGKKYSVQSGTWSIIEEEMSVTLEEIVPAVDMAEVVIPDPFNPRDEYHRHPEIEDHISINPAILLDWMRSNDGAYDHTLPGTSIPVIVSRKEAVTPFQLDYDAGTPQFSLTGATVTPNYAENANKIYIADGQLISHNMHSLSRDEIESIRQDGLTYDPTVSFTITAQEITLANNNEHGVYIKVPIEAEV